MLLHGNADDGNNNEDELPTASRGSSSTAYLFTLRTTDVPFLFTFFVSGTLLLVCLVFRLLLRFVKSSSVVAGGVCLLIEE